jgi:transglutaminase-like putative cysteine protease
MLPLGPFLRDTTVVDWRQPAIRALARRLGRGRRPPDVVRACFEWVRDRIPHTVDHALDRVTCGASEVLREGTGFCYAKSHLLAALLRANGIAAGFVYQRLAIPGGRRFCLHGLNAVWLPETGWHRVDARGPRPGLRADFDLRREILPYACRTPGERLFPGVWAEPWPIVVDALRTHRDRARLEAHLPDAPDPPPSSVVSATAVTDAPR